MAKLVDAYASGAYGETLGGSSPLLGTCWLWLNRNKADIILFYAGVAKLVDAQS